MDLEQEEEGTDDENYEPLVTSQNPTERMMARRLRIQRRVEALRKYYFLSLEVMINIKRNKQFRQKEAREKAGEDATIEPEITKTPIEMQVEKSMELLERLAQEGEEYVTNVRVATEARETDRREHEGIGKEKLLKDLEEEAAAAEAMFNEIADKWSGILKYNDPLHINEEITSQREKCDELIKQKDAIIANLKGKLRTAEINFAIDQRKQIEDVNSISRRIENQIIVMRKAYRQELQMIEDVILTERQLLIEANNKKWDELYKKRDQEEKSNAEKRSEDYWNFVQDMDNLNRDFQELYRETTIKLENDCDELQRELERIKTDALMNSEKLDYNYQILKKREDENLIIRSQQKRRINKLQDVINSLRKKMNDYHKTTSQQITKLTEEVKKLSQNVLDIEKKADHLAEVNNIKFKKVWSMNKERADKLFKRILQIDRVLHEQQLGLVWKCPSEKIPSKSDLESYKTAMSLLSEDLPKLSVKKPKSVSIGTEFMETERDEEGAVYKRTIRHILNLIADKTGFLIEDQLNAILEPYIEPERNLIKIDNVFSALNVTKKTDIDLLLEFFLPYMFCPICNVSTTEKPAVGEDESVMRVHEMDPANIVDLPSDAGSAGKVHENVVEVLKEASVLEDPGGTVVDLGPISVTIFDGNLKGECRGPETTLEEKKEMESVEGSLEVYMKEKVACQYQHPLVISSVYVLKALKEFLGKYHLPKASMPTMGARLSYRRSTMSRLFAATDIETYWKKYTDIFPPEREQLWDSLLEGLKKYHELLKARKTASEEVMSLRQQNEDLRRIFANYIDKSDIPFNKL
ncbi:NYD-SP28 domain containing protein [Asbolus verrucosus]|uniref:NYD-SP28 domain containing protein n=1 Tax=Asbolus verrucosus TaxID=1661398 RepID=A0A482VP98_ASBVE|nr:NYD-SP28 domain containing protein [Asbolus verrucosus]